MKYIDKKDKELKIVKPIGVGEMDFTGEVNTYKAILKEERDLGVLLVEANKKALSWLKKHGFNDYEVVQPITLNFYAKGEELDKSSKEYERVNKGQNIATIASDLISNNTSSAQLKDIIGESAWGKMEKLAKVYSLVHGYGIKKKVDEALTREKRKEYGKLSSEVGEITGKLRIVRDSKQSSKEFVSYIKDLATIARVAGKQS